MIRYGVAREPAGTARSGAFARVFARGCLALLGAARRLRSVFFIVLVAHVLERGGDVPDVTERIFHAAAAVTPLLIFHGIDQFGA